MATRSTTVYADQKTVDYVKEVAVATTLTTSDTGKVIYLKSATGRAITLPAPTSGFNVRIITAQLFATTAFTIVAPSAILRGGAVVNSVFVPSAGTTTITLSATAETIGDYIELKSDGVSYFVSGNGAQAASIAFS